MSIENLSKILAPAEFEAFTSYSELLLEAYRVSSTLTLQSLIPILGNPPRIPQSPDLDARLEAYDERVLYGNKALSIEEYLRNVVSA